jgi:hypothetical protein
VAAPTGLTRLTARHAGQTNEIAAGREVVDSFTKRFVTGVSWVGC